MKYARVLICFLLLVCTGCVQTETLEAQIGSALTEAETCAVNQPNYEHVYYAYYLQPGIGRISSEETGNVFSWHGNKFTMNLNVAAIINSAYYVDASPDIVTVEPMLQYQGRYLDANRVSHDYCFSVYEAGEQVFLDYRDDRVFMNANTVSSEAAGLAGVMLETARNVRIDRAGILEVFSYRETISNMRKRLDLFENISPENGVIDELLIKDDDYTRSNDGGAQSTGPLDE